MRFLRSLSSLLVFSLCSIVFVNTSCWAARWWEVTTSDNGSITYIDLDTIEVVNKDLLTAWGKTVIKNEKKLKSEDDYVKGSRVASSKDYTIYNCTSKTLKTLEQVEYGVSGQVLRSISNPNGEFNIVVPDTVGKTELEFVCGLQEKLNMGLIGSTLYKSLMAEQMKKILLGDYRPESTHEPTMPIASPDTKLEPTFIEPSQEQMRKIQQRHKRL
jgi:hypothetical protein